jgi:hypothetical protein
MYLGADVGHPGPGIAKLSVTGLVFSYNEGARYAVLTVANANLVWSDENVFCRNFLECAPTLSSLILSVLCLFKHICADFYFRKWTLGHVRSPILNTSKPSILQPRRPTQVTQFAFFFLSLTSHAYRFSACSR